MKKEIDVNIEKRFKNIKKIDVMSAVFFSYSL